MEEKEKEVDEGGGSIYDINLRIMSETSQQKVLAFSFVICTVGSACECLQCRCPTDRMRRRHNSWATQLQTGVIIPAALGRSTYIQSFETKWSPAILFYSPHIRPALLGVARRIFPGVTARHDSGACKQNIMQITKENGFARDCLPDAVSPSFCGSGQSVSNTRTPRIDRP